MGIEDLFRLVPPLRAWRAPSPFRQSVYNTRRRENAPNPTCTLVLSNHPKGTLLTEGFLWARTGPESVDDLRICCRRSHTGCYTLRDQDQGTDSLAPFTWTWAELSAWSSWAFTLNQTPRSCSKKHLQNSRDKSASLGELW